MSVKVTVPNSKTINTSIVSKRITADLDTLANVDVTGIQDGYTLVYNEDTNKWEATNVNAIVATPTVISGGTY
jgi:hypothetical protein